MTATIGHVIRTLSVAALLVAAAMSLPAGDIQAGAPCQNNPVGTPPRNCCVYKGVEYIPGSHFSVRNQDYTCDDGGEWIIITDEKFDPGTPPPSSPFPRVSVTPGPDGGVRSPR